MNYLSIYNALVSNAKSKDRRKRKYADSRYVYYERHHVIPKCVGGKDNKENLVLFTAREHFVAHQLLIKIYPEQHKLVFALRMMCRNNNKNHIRNNTEYEWIKRRIAKESSMAQKGRPGKGHKFSKGHTLSTGSKNSMYGKKHSEETKKLQSEKAKERDPTSYDSVRQPKAESHKENIRISKRKQQYKLISPNGTETIFDRCKEASVFSGISTSVLIKLAGNRYGFTHCRNWQCIVVPI